ncbi:MAG: KH domain-containing protein [Ruminococcaceae bacterium]|nr:KH domain-containing protein [Oscillospiraceae bacterium]
MTDLKQTLHNIAAAIVDDPSSVVVTVNETETTVNLTLSVAPDDMGMVIGKGGRIAKAIRMVIKAAAADCPKKVNVDIR